MAISDANKLLMLSSDGAIETILSGLLLTSPRRSEKGADEIQEACAVLLLSLALFTPWAEVLRAHQGAMRALHDLRDGELGTETSRRSAESALFELQGWKVEAPSGVVASPGCAKHVMVSYCWEQQAVIKRVHAALVGRGYRVWIDIEQMRGSTVESMALAVENAEVMLIGVSRAYKESTNCRLEAQYAMQREVAMVPLMLVDGYRADGWLGMLIGTRLWYGFWGVVLSDAALFEGKVAELCRELGDRGQDQSLITTSGSNVTRDDGVRDADPAIAALRSELRDLKSRALWKRAEAAGLSEEAMEEAEEADDEKAALIELLVAEHQQELPMATGGRGGGDDPAIAALRSELRDLKSRALWKRAEAAGLSEEAMEEAEEADDEKAALIELLVAEHQQELPMATGGRGGGDDSAIAALRSELRDLKSRALWKRAEAAGLSEEAMEEAEEADDEKAALIELLVAEHQQELPMATGGRGGGDDPAIAALRSELRDLKSRALRKRAEAAGLSEEAMEEAEEADDEKAALIELLVAEHRAAATPKVKEMLPKPHYGGARIP
eukprot:SAG31_NODE_14_length_37953_cov_109.719660_28_plen_555_part_00